jgi:hypothetical protein
VNRAPGLAGTRSGNAFSFLPILLPCVATLFPSQDKSNGEKHASFFVAFWQLLSSGNGAEFDFRPSIGAKMQRFVSSIELFLLCLQNGSCQIGCQRIGLLLPKHFSSLRTSICKIARLLAPVSHPVKSASEYRCKYWNLLHIILPSPNGMVLEEEDAKERGDWIEAFICPAIFITISVAIFCAL